MDAEAVTAEATRPLRHPVLVQRWHDLAFLHWAVDPADVAPLLPPGTRPDVLGGRTYVGLVAFRMVRLGLLAGPGLPYLGSFGETNVRVYSVDTAGRRAVVFLSLDAARLLPVLAARVSLRLPYLWSRMRVRRDGDLLTYTCRRRWPGPAGTRSTLRVRVGPAIAEPSPLEHFLTARWGLHTRAYGRTLHMPNVHPRWPLHRAELVHLDDELVGAAGLTPPESAPVSVLWSPGVAVRFGAPVAVH
ncbi:YqjF family protein [Micromonospora sp. URMC 103]|uniref:YqjF family protein n=1 Tax=Micromonospora sp. URMC 103 TaxID=3423406 RepID=UPI003F1DC318